MGWRSEPRAPGGAGPSPSPPLPRCAASEPPPVSSQLKGGQGGQRAPRPAAGAQRCPCGPGTSLGWARGLQPEPLPAAAGLSPAPCRAWEARPGAGRAAGLAPPTAHARGEPGETRPVAHPGAVPAPAPESRAGSPGNVRGKDGAQRFEMRRGPGVPRSGHPEPESPHSVPAQAELLKVAQKPHQLRPLRSNCPNAAIAN